MNQTVYLPSFQAQMLEFYENLAPNATLDDACYAYYEEADELDDALFEYRHTLTEPCAGNCACGTDAREHLAKELADVVFTLYGLAIKAGIDLDEALGIVCDDNLKKIRTEDGKVSKREGYVAPSMNGALL